MISSKTVLSFLMKRKPNWMNLTGISRKAVTKFASPPDFSVLLALQVWTKTYSAAFDRLPASVRDAVQDKVDRMGENLAQFSHERLKGRPEFRLRAGDYRVLYEFDLSQGRIILHFVGHRREVYR